MTTASFRAVSHEGGVAAHPEEADGLREILLQLESRANAVRELHAQRGGPSPQWWYCSECGSDSEWPCPTIAVLDGVQAQGEEQ